MRYEKPNRAGSLPPFIVNYFDKGSKKCQDLLLLVTFVIIMLSLLATALIRNETLLINYPSNNL